MLNSLHILAQSTPDISSVPADFVKNWWIMAAFAVVIGLQIWNTVQSRKDQHRVISGKLTTDEEIKFAEKPDVVRLVQEVDEMEVETQKALEGIRTMIVGEVKGFTTSLDKFKESIRAEIKADIASVTDRVSRQGERISAMEATVDAWRK